MAEAELPGGLHAVTPVPPGLVHRHVDANGRVLQSTAGVLKPGNVIWVANAHRSRQRRYSDWTYDGGGEVQWLAGYDNHKPPPGPPQLCLEQTRASRARSSPMKRLCDRHGGRPRIRPLRVQPCGAGLPPAGLDLQSNLLLAGARPGLWLWIAPTGGSQSSFTPPPLTPTPPLPSRSLAVSHPKAACWYPPRSPGRGSRPIR